jgi:hypothetical protein
MPVVVLEDVRFGMGFRVMLARVFVVVLVLMLTCVTGVAVAVLIMFARRAVFVPAVMGRGQAGRGKQSDSQGKSGLFQHDVHPFLD